LLIPRSLDRREITGHLAILILLDLHHFPAPSLNPIHQFADAVGVRRDPRLHLILERPPAPELLLHDVAATGAEPLLRSAQLRGLIGIQVELLRHAIVEPLLDLRPQSPRLGGITRRAHAVTLLGGETPPRPPGEQDGKAE